MKKAILICSQNWYHFTKILNGCLKFLNQNIFENFYIIYILMSEIQPDQNNNNNNNDNKKEEVEPKEKKKWRRINERNSRNQEKALQIIWATMGIEGPKI